MGRPLGTEAATLLRLPFCISVLNRDRPCRILAEAVD